LLLSRRRVSRIIRYDKQDCRDTRKTFREEASALDRRAAKADAFADVKLDDLLASLFARLTERQKVVVLRRLEGWTNAEIAQHVGRCERAIERDLAAIRDRCRSHPDLAPLLESPESLFGGLPE
jgi:RNA polymerase sigma-70 factor (ECF subfamily)